MTPHRRNSQDVVERTEENAEYLDRRRRGGGGGSDCGRRLLRHGRALVPAGTITILTDSEPYAEAVALNASAVSGLEALVVAEGDFGGIYPTFFSEKWKADGRRCYVRKYRKAC